MEGLGGRMLPGMKSIRDVPVPGLYCNVSRGCWQMLNVFQTYEHIPYVIYSHLSHSVGLCSGFGANNGAALWSTEKTLGDTGQLSVTESCNRQIHVSVMHHIFVNIWDLCVWGGQGRVGQLQQSEQAMASLTAGGPCSLSWYWASKKSIMYGSGQVPLKVFALDNKRQPNLCLTVLGCECRYSCVCRKLQSSKWVVSFHV
jgi:hypothetical protein